MNSSEESELVKRVREIAAQGRKGSPRLCAGVSTSSSEESELVKRVREIEAQGREGFYFRSSYKSLQVGLIELIKFLLNSLLYFFI